MDQPIDLFYSYAHEDEVLRNELAGHLKIMERRGVIRSWYDRDIVPGQGWDGEIEDALANADIVLLLVSSDFINSDYIWSVELDRAMRRHAHGDTTVIPILVRACDFEDAPFARLQGLPTDLRAVTSWPNRDEAWTDVAKGIRRAVGAIRERTAARSAALPKMSDTAASAPAPPGGHPVTSPAGARAVAIAEETPRVSVPAAGDDIAADVTLSRLLATSVEQINRAVEARGSAPADPVAAQRTALELIDVPEQKRILWVDDRPHNNAREIAVLARLQIEVVTVTSTAAALARIASDAEPFDLIISDWQRAEAHPGAASAAIALLGALRERGYDIPVVLYHGTFDSARRDTLRRLALDAGAVGETTQPDALFALVAAQFTHARGSGD